MEIVVIGAGLSGLAFAAAMRRKAPGARVTVYKRDTDPSSRALLELRPAPGDERNLTIRVQRQQLKRALLDPVGDGAELRFGQPCAAAADGRPWTRPHCPTGRPGCCGCARSGSTAAASRS
jgi:glycine/D-amino acid oxidase-like deaminating enzyme